MARICSEESAISSAVAWAPHAITTAWGTRSGNATAHSSARWPPIEPPTTAAQRGMPRWSASAASTTTWSRIVTVGKREPYGAPVSGSSDAGPVLPWQPPSTLGQMTKNRSVSIGRPGPTTGSHQPSRRWPGPAGPAAWLSPVSAWSSSSAFEPSAASVPHVSYAMVTCAAGRRSRGRAGAPESVVNRRRPGGSPGCQAPVTGTGAAVLTE